MNVSNIFAYIWCEEHMTAVIVCFQNDYWTRWFYVSKHCCE